MDTIEDAKKFFDEAQKKEPMTGLGSWRSSALSNIPFVTRPTIHKLMVDFAASLQTPSNEKYGWVKASERLSQHYIKVCCKLINSDYYFTGSYDWSTKLYVSVTGHRYEVEQVEWLDESTPIPILTPCVLEERVKELENKLIEEGRIADESHAAFVNSEKEVERLKELLEKEVRDYYAMVFPFSDKDRRNAKWKQYQTENNL